jgi:hypothetical protein
LGIGVARGAWGVVLGFKAGCVGDRLLLCCSVLDVDGKSTLLSVGLVTKITKEVATKNTNRRENEGWGGVWGWGWVLRATSQRLPACLS